MRRIGSAENGAYITPGPFGLGKTKTKTKTKTYDTSAASALVKSVLRQPSVSELPDWCASNPACRSGWIVRRTAVNGCVDTHLARLDLQGQLQRIKARLLQVAAMKPK